MKRTKQILLALGLSLLSSVSLLAATSTWSGASGSLWTTALNWDTAPTGGEDIVFPSVANQTVDLAGGAYSIATLTFNSPNGYSLANGGLTLGGNVTQSGAGAVTNDISLDLGSATRNFGGAGTGLARFNGAISGTTAGLNITGGSYALAAVNGFDGGLAANGGTVQLIQAGFGDLNYEAGFDPAGSGAVTLNGGRIELSAEDPAGTVYNKRTTTFGASGGTLVYGDYNKLIPGNTLNQSVFNGPTRIEVYPAPIPFIDPVSGADNQPGPMQLQYPSGTGVLTLVLRNGANARFQQWSATPFAGTIIVDGQPGGDMLADQQASAPNQGTNIVYLCINNPNANPVTWFTNVLGGIFLKNAMQIFETHSGTRQLDCDVTLLPGARVALQGRPVATKTTDLGIGIAGSGRTFRIQNDAIAQLDLRIAQWAGSSGGGSVVLNSSTVIEAGGTLRVARTVASDAGVTVNNIQMRAPIQGQGTAAEEAIFDIQLDAGASSKDGVSFYSTTIITVNGSGTGGLRLQAKSAAAMANLLNGRTDTITGSGGTLTLAVTNNDTLTGIRGPSNPLPVALCLDKQGGNSPIYVFDNNSTSLANWAGLVLKGVTAVENDSSANSLQALTLAASATIQMGTGAGSGAILNFANSSAKTWSGTLSIANWNGSYTGGGPDQVKFGTDATGLTVAQLAQVTWIAPNGGANVVGARILATGEIVPPSTMITSPAIVNGEFVFSVVPADIAQTSIIQWATNLTPTVNWYSILTNTGAFNFTNTLPYPEVFYRVLVP